MSTPPTTDTDALSWAMAAQREADEAWRECFFEARLGGWLEEAVRSSPHSRTQALAMTRAENERRGRSVRWGDGYS